MTESITRTWWAEESLSSVRCEKGMTPWSIEFSLRGLSWLSFCGLSPGAFRIRTSSTSFRPNGDRELLPEGLSCLVWAPSDLSQTSALREPAGVSTRRVRSRMFGVGAWNLGIRKKRDVRTFSST
jgi:hypothetical protein